MENEIFRIEKNGSEIVLEHCSSEVSGDIVIPNGVTTIGAGAFSDCSSLTSITIPNSVTSIGSLAFYRCYSLTSITIPNSVTSIGSQAFYRCDSLTSICIPNSVESIGSRAFGDCSSLTSITIPNSVESIGEGAFYCCSSLTSITIPNSVTSIGNEAFYRCYSLTSITIPNSVTSIGDYAFRGCSSLTFITIPDSVTSIGDEAFRGCSELSSINIPDSVEEIGSDVFLGCYSLPIKNDLLYAGTYLAGVGDTTKEAYCVPFSTRVCPGAFSECNQLDTIILTDFAKTQKTAIYYAGYDHSIDLILYAKKGLSNYGYSHPDVRGVLKVSVSRNEVSEEDYNRIVLFFNKNFDDSIDFRYQLVFEAPQPCKELSPIPGYIRVTCPYTYSETGLDEYIDINTKYIFCTEPKNIGCTTPCHGCKISIGTGNGDSAISSIVVYESKELVDQKIKESLENLSKQVGGAAGLLNELEHLLSQTTEEK